MHQDAKTMENLKDLSIISLYIFTKQMYKSFIERRLNKQVIHKRNYINQKH